MGESRKSRDEEAEVKLYCDVQGQGGIGGDRGRQDTSRIVVQLDVPANQIIEWKSQLLARSEAVFIVKAERKLISNEPTMQELQSKIGELMMEKDS